MATSLASQLQIIRSVTHSDVEFGKRPFTRPSVLFDPKEAADIDTETIFNIAESGLEVLIEADQRFGIYKDVLFSRKTKDLDRELLSAEENKPIDASISSYLRLLSGYFHLPSSLRTLEYLIRRYKVHVYNYEDLILCSLPYHDTHAFVRIIQLLDTGNSKWKFLEAVKVSGAPLPRNVLVQQCICDMGVLGALCDYASFMKKFPPSKPLIVLCTSVMVELLGSMEKISSDSLNRILPFVYSGLQIGAKGGKDHMAGALMIVGLMGSKAELNPKLVNCLIRSVAEVSQADTRESSDLPWLRLSLMSLISLFQSQSVTSFPKKALDILKENRGIASVVFELSREFNIDRFLTYLLCSLIDHSSDDKCCHLLVSIIELVPMKTNLERIISKLLVSSFKMLERGINLTSAELGTLAYQVLMILQKRYPSEVRCVMHKLLEDKFQDNKNYFSFHKLCDVGGADSESPSTMSASKTWLALHHPNAEVRCAALSSLGKSDISKSDTGDSEMFASIQNAIQCQLYDPDLLVVQAVLSIDALPSIINSSDLFEALDDVLKRCFSILISSSPEKTTLAADVAFMFLKVATSNFHGHVDYSKRVAAAMFPLLLFLPKTQKLNLSILELAKEVEWSFYSNLSNISLEEKESITAINMKIVNNLAEAFLGHPDDCLQWVGKSCNDSSLSKMLLFLIVMQSFIIPMHDFGKFSTLFDACFSFLKIEWQIIDSSADAKLKEENIKMLKWDCLYFLDKLSGTSNLEAFKTDIMVCIFWRLLVALSFLAASDYLSDDQVSWIFNRCRDLFVFFSTLHSKQMFREHICYLVTNCRLALVGFLAAFFTDKGISTAVQLESLYCFSLLSLHGDGGLLYEFLGSFPLLLIPLSSNNQDVRIAAMGCIEGMSAQFHRVDCLVKKNGECITWSDFLLELLKMIVQQKMMILSDKKFLSSFLTALLGSTDHLLIPQNIEYKFDSSTKESILSFIVSSALCQSTSIKLTVLSLLKGLGSKLMHVKGVKMMLSVLLKQRRKYFFGRFTLFQKLSDDEVKILCLLLEICAIALLEGHDLSEYLLMGLQADEYSNEFGVTEPIITVLRNLNDEICCTMSTEKQDSVFHNLVFLFRNANAIVQKATRDALLRLSLTCSMVERTLSFILKQKLTVISTMYYKRKKKPKNHETCRSDGETLCTRGTEVGFLCSILDILMLKKDMPLRENLLGSLFQLLGKVFSDEWVITKGQGIEASSDVSEASTSICHIQQTLLFILHDILGSMKNASSLENELAEAIDVKMLVRCASAANDTITRNHVFSLLSSIATVLPDKISDHMTEIIPVIGESTVTQIDSYSRRVFEDVISAVIPCWLSRTGSTVELLQVFINVLPDIPENRRLSIVSYLLRALGESNSLASLLLLLFSSLALRKQTASVDDDDSVHVNFTNSGWEHAFATQICQQYSSLIWLPSLVSLLQQLRADGLRQFPELLCAMQFTLQKLQDPEFVFKSESNEDGHLVQKNLRKLMMHVVLILQHITVEQKKNDSLVALFNELKECGHAVLKTIKNVMIPSSYFRCSIRLLGRGDADVQKKVLGLVSESIAESGSALNTLGRKKSKADMGGDWFQRDDISLKYFDKMCLKIASLIDGWADESDASLKISAVSTLKILAASTSRSIFSSCLPPVAQGIASASHVVSSACLLAAAALLDAVGVQALAELPRMMDSIVKVSRGISSCPTATRGSLLQAVLVVLEAVVGKLGGFLNPYLADIIEFLLLNKEFASSSKAKLKSKADTIQKLVVEKIPVRLVLPPLMNLFPVAVQHGDSSVMACFEMLSALLSAMDRPSVSSFRGAVFDFCLRGLDLRSRHPVSIRDVRLVERSVVDAIICLTMKLTEAMFRPLFVASIEWAESNKDEIATPSGATLERAISFYVLVNQLAESHRSLFVPYFKYLLDDCVRHLSASQAKSSAGPVRKKKKASSIDEVAAERDAAEEIGYSIRLWHLRALVVSSLHKCFLFDAGNLRVLDSPTFQFLLKPLVSQLAQDPPFLLVKYPCVPSLEEVDDMIVACVGQMAVTAASDLLWKPLNHEVLLQTRSENLRTRILGLRVVKFLLDSLREEYLVFLAETIPFLAELLEDVEMPVKTLAQDILKEMELLSGEDIKQYLH